jgi:TM2 domain-containing membrane protein YozV
METGQHGQAIPTFRRVVYFDTSGMLAEQSFEKLGDCYTWMNKAGKAHYYYDLAYQHAGADSVKTLLALKKVHVYLLEKKYDYASIEMAGIPVQGQGSLLETKRTYQGIIAYKTGEFEKARQQFLLAAGDSVQKQAIDSLFREVEKMNRLNPKLARYLSIFLPGSGQLYAGHPVEAANSFLLTTAFWGLYVYTMINYSLVDAVLAVIPWFQRYYTGGFFQAEELAQQKIAEERSKVFNELIDVMDKERNR